MYLVINKCVTAVKVSHFSGHYLRNRSTLDIGVLGYIGIVEHKEHSPEVFHIPPGTPCVHFVLGHTFYTDSVYEFTVKFEISYYILRLYVSTFYLLL